MHTFFTFFELLHTLSPTLLASSKCLPDSWSSIRTAVYWAAFNCTGRCLLDTHI